jgi:hypothetical protein
LPSAFQRVKVRLGTQKGTDKVNGLGSLINNRRFEVFPSHPHEQVTPKQEHMGGNLSGDFSPLPQVTTSSMFC